MFGGQVLTKAGSISDAQARAQFIANILAITGDTRLFWLPDAGDTTTATD